MFMRVNFLAAVAIVFMLSCQAQATRIGALTKYTENPYETWNILKGFHGKNDCVLFYDSLQEILLSLFRGNIDEADLPGITGNYVIRSNPGLRTKCIVRMKSQYLVFGFMKGNEDLRNKFNSALSEINADKTLQTLKKRYLNSKPEFKPEIKFANFKQAQTIRVAVTGDLPPVDFVDAEGKPAGFNAALLAEIAKRLKINIKIIHINTSARSSALSSGRADVVFWYQLSEFDGFNQDIPEGIIVSEPYYDWDYFIHISLKNM